MSAVLRGKKARRDYLGPQATKVQLALQATKALRVQPVPEDQQALRDLRVKKGFVVLRAFKGYRASAVLQGRQDHKASRGRQASRGRRGLQASRDRQENRGRQVQQDPTTLTAKKIY